MGVRDFQTIRVTFCQRIKNFDIEIRLAEARSLDTIRFDI